VRPGDLEDRHNQVGPALAHQWLPWIRGHQHGVDPYRQEVSLSPLSKLALSLYMQPILTYNLTAPAWGGSAASGSGSRTPAWKADGSRTAYGGGGMGGGRTPAWNSGARTPFDSSSGGGSSGFDAFAAGSRTPAWGAAAGGGGGGGGGRTPAWNANGSSNNNLGSSRYDAPTPGGDYSAPTPGAYPTAPTPGASGSAATPRWADSAPTPGALNAPTPGGGGGGGGRHHQQPYDAPTPAVAATPGATDDNPTYFDDSE
jgi:transcription elongation factor SPT5